MTSIDNPPQETDLPIKHDGNNTPNQSNSIHQNNNNAEQRAGESLSNKEILEILPFYDCLDFENEDSQQAGNSCFLSSASSSHSQSAITGDQIQPTESFSCVKPTSSTLSSDNTDKTPKPSYFETLLAYSNEDSALESSYPLTFVKGSTASTYKQLAQSSEPFVTSVDDDPPPNTFQSNVRLDGTKINSVDKSKIETVMKDLFNQVSLDSAQSNNSLPSEARSSTKVFDKKTVKSNSSGVGYADLTQNSPRKPQQRQSISFKKREDDDNLANFERQPFSKLDDGTSETQIQEVNIDISVDEKVDSIPPSQNNILEVSISSDNSDGLDNDIKPPSFINNLIDKLSNFFNEKSKLHTFVSILIVSTLVYCIFESYTLFYSKHNGNILTRIFVLKTVLTIFSILNILFLLIAILSDSESPVGQLRFKYREVVFGLFGLNVFFFLRRIIELGVNLNNIKLKPVLIFTNVAILIISGVALALNRKVPIKYYLAYLSYVLSTFIIIRPLSSDLLFSNNYLIQN